MHCRDPEDQGLQWPYLSPHFPFPNHLFLKKVDIWHYTRGTEQKSHNHSCQNSYRVFVMPPLWLVPMPWKMTEEEGAFWHGLDLEMWE